MASSGSEWQSDEVLAEINMTPLVDVMLVLLIIFIVTIPVINHAVKVSLPQEATQPDQVKPSHIDLTINAVGDIFWNAEKIDAPSLVQRLSGAAKQEPKPEVRLRADKTIAYERVMRIIATCNRAGIGKIGFVTEPD